MTVSVGTFEDLQPDQHQPIDRNPSLECDGPCGESFDWQEYWKPRYTLGEPRKALLLCDECLSVAIEYHDRVTRNRQLTEFQGGEHE